MKVLITKSTEDLWYNVGEIHEVIDGKMANSYKSKTIIGAGILKNHCQPLPEWSEKCWVRDEDDEDWCEEFFIGVNPLSDRKYITYEEKGYIGMNKQISLTDPNKKEVPEYTWDDLREKLGHEFKIKKQ